MTLLRRVSRIIAPLLSYGERSCDAKVGLNPRAATLELLMKEAKLKIRFLSCALLALIVLLSPLRVSSQSEEGSHAALAAESVGGGCLADTRASGDEQTGRGFDLANLDRSVSPCDDFFQFADGGWIKNHPIPPAYPRWAAFDVLRDHNEDVLRQILDEAAKDKSYGARIEPAEDRRFLRQLHGRSLQSRRLAPSLSMPNSSASRI